MVDENTQTQTQNSQIEWSQNTPSFIPTIWGRLYSTKVSLNGRRCWKNIDTNYPEYYDLIQGEFSLGRALDCTFVMKKDVIQEYIIKNVSKKHFTIKRELSKSPIDIQSPAIITDLSYNGTFVNGEKIGKFNSRVLDDNDVISVTHPFVKIFVFKDLLKNDQDKVSKEISQKYYISRTLGQGACGLVKLVYNKTKCTKHAMKIIKKNRLTNGQLNHLNDPVKIMNEIKIMKALSHPCIISIEEVFDTSDAVYIILEFMRGGELFDKITKHGRLPETLLRFLFRQMVLAVKYLHSQGITHRDLKPENVLLEDKEDETLVKITDFGLSKFVGEDSFMKTLCGTPLYLAPEILRANGLRSYGPEVDVWSLGVIFFVSLVGYLPFSSDYKDYSLKEQIMNGVYHFSNEHWNSVSPLAKNLMRRMLTVQVKRRITLDEILNHGWMQDPNLQPVPKLTLVKSHEILHTSVCKMSSGHEYVWPKFRNYRGELLDKDVINRVDKLLNTAEIKDFHQLTVSSCSTQHSNNTNKLNNATFVNVKRFRSDSSNPFEPAAKKQKFEALEQSSDKSDDTNTSSLNMDNVATCSNC